MIYLHNNTDVQEIYIPRQKTINVGPTGIDLSNYLTSGETIELINSTVDDTVEEKMEGYATEQWVENQGYLTEHQSLDNYYTKSEVDQAIENIDVSGQIEPILDEISDLKDKDNELTQSLAQKANKSDLDGLASEQWVQEQGYLTEHQSLAGLVSSVDYVSSAKTINFYDKGNNLIDTIDATEFIKDGMVSNVEISNGNLVISFNTDAGKQPITIPLTDIFNPANYYTKTEIDESGFATQTWVQEQGYLTQHQSLNNYYTITDINNILNQQDLKNSEKEEVISTSLNELNDRIPSTEDIEEVVNEAVSGIPTEFKTINNESIIGSGNITIQGGGDTSNLLKEVKFSEISHRTSGGYTYQVPVLKNTKGNDTSVDYTQLSFKTINGQRILKESGDTDGEVVINVPTKTSDLTNDSGFITEHQSLDNYYTKTEVDSALNEKANVYDVVDPTTFNQTVQNLEEEIANIPINEYTAGNNIDITNNEISVTGITVPSTTSELTNDSGFITSADLPDTSDFVTSAQVQNQITAATATKQDTLVSGTNIKTINNESILGSGNITIQGGGGGETVIELTRAQYEALESYAPNTTYVITDAAAVDLNDFATKTDVEESISEVNDTISTKATKANTTARSGYYWPYWNAEGIITGSTGPAYQSSQNINGSNYTFYRNTNAALPASFAPTTAGTKGQPLLSNGSGAPQWGAYKFVFCSQSDYDALTTKDATTIYFIVDEN